MMRKEQPDHCSFCGRHKRDGGVMVASPDNRFAICDRCHSKARDAISNPSDARKVIELHPKGAA